MAECPGETGMDPDENDQLSAGSLFTTISCVGDSNDHVESCSVTHCSVCTTETELETKSELCVERTDVGFDHDSIGELAHPDKNMADSLFSPPVGDESALVLSDESCEGCSQYCEQPSQPMCIGKRVNSVDIEKFDQLSAGDVGTSMPFVKDCKDHLENPSQLALSSKRIQGTNKSVQQSLSNANGKDRLECDGTHLDQSLSEYFDVQTAYPFLCHEDTINYVKRSKVMFIMRGLPGSGKSTIVQHLKETYPDLIVCSADDFFCSENGSYFRDSAKLSEAHDQCKLKAEHAVREKKLHIAIDNTNVREWEMKAYFHLAHFEGYIVLLVIPCTPWAFDPVVLSQCNLHGVSSEHLESKLRHFEEVLPYYWGWFISDEDSVQLKALGVKHFINCIRLISEFSHFLPVRVSDSVDARLFNEVYDCSPLALHCTSFFAGRRNRSAAVVNYAHSEAVKKAMGLAFKIAITGLILTPRTAGARVRLNDQQNLLFERDAGERHTRKQGDRAHITLGWAKGFNAAQAGFDLLEIIDCESKKSSGVQKANADDARIIHYGEGRCLVTFSNPLYVDALFSADY